MDEGTELLLPESTRLVHIGPHKTGSTAVQVAFHDARELLGQYGVHYAGAHRRPKLAGWSIGLAGKKFGTARPPEKHWDRLVAEVEAAGDQRVCISNEDFGRATEDQRTRIITDLGGDRAHVVAVARRLDGYLPSQWQERVKAGMTLAWEDWLHVVLDEPAAGKPAYEWTNVWRAHDVGGLLRNWSEVVGPDRITLIVSDGSDRDLLPRTFERLLGLPTGLLVPDPSRSNVSLSWAETEAVRLAHRAFARAGVDRRARDPWIESGMLKAVRGRQAPRVGPTSPPFPTWAAQRLRDLGEERAQAVRETPVRVVGSPDALLAGSDLPVGDPAAAPPLDLDTVGAMTAALIRATAERVPGLAADPAEV